jgi:hypothetical protein
MGMKRDSTAAIYIRKSTKQEDGRSLKGQEQDCQERASRLGLARRTISVGKPTLC